MSDTTMYIFVHIRHPAVIATEIKTDPHIEGGLLHSYVIKK
jgi:hypothetical protein